MTEWYVVGVIGIFIGGLLWIVFEATQHANKSTKAEELEDTLDALQRVNDKRISVDIDDL